MAGTSVGNGASLIESTGATACAAAGGCTAGIGLVSFALINAQPPTVAANEAAVISIFTPGVPVLGFWLGLTGGMSIFPFGINIRPSHSLAAKCCLQTLDEFLFF